MRKLLTIVTLLFISTAAFAVEPSITIEVESQTIGLDETAIIKIISDTKAGQVEMPEVPENCQLSYQGLSTSFNVSVVNGRRQQSNSYIYTFVFVSDKIGTYKLDPFTVKIGGQNYSTESVTIKVVKEPQHASQNSQDDIFNAFFGNNRARAFQPEAFLRLYFNSTNVYQNQQTVVEVYAYANDQSILASQMVEASQLMTDKFIFYDVTQSVTNLGEVVEDSSAGEGFYRRLMKRYICFPIDSGTLVMRPPVFVAVSQYGQIKVASENVGIASRAVGRQGGLSYIGDLNVDSELSTNVQEVGKVIEMKIELTGDGNLKVFSNPYGNYTTDDYFISSPTTEIKPLEQRGNSYYFGAAISYTLIAKKAGLLKVPPVRLDYYDSQMRPQTLIIPGGTVKILPPAGETTTFIDMTTKVLGVLKNFRFVLLAPWFIAILAVVLLMPFVAWIYGKHNNRMNADDNYARKFLAGKRFGKYFEESRRLLNEKKYKEFYIALQKGLFYYITDKLGIPQGLGAREIAEKMSGRNIAQETVERFKAAYELCARNVYSGITDEASAEDTLEKVKAIVETIR